LGGVGVGLNVGITVLGNKDEKPCARYRKRLGGAIPQNRPNVRDCRRMGNNVWSGLLTREGLGVILCGGCDTNICCAAKRARVKARRRMSERLEESASE
jgi:hypothetical protein